MTMLKKYYYTKDWESKGIQKVKSGAEPRELGKVFYSVDWQELRFNTDAFLTVVEARANVVKRHKAAIRSAERKLAKLKAFDPSTVLIW